MKQKYFKLLVSLAILIGTAFTGTVVAQLIKTAARVTSSINELYRYDVNVYPLGDSTFYLDKALTGMTISATTGVISWTPTAMDQGGEVAVRVRVGTFEETQTFTVYVSNAVVCDESMVSYWKLDETTGTTFVDFKGGHNAITGVAPKSVTGVVNNGQEFDPTKDIRLSVLDNANQYDWIQGGDVSAAIWFKCNIDINSTNGPQVMMGRLGPSGSTESQHWWWFGLDTNNYVAFYGTNDVGTYPVADPGYPNLIGGHSTYGIHYMDDVWHLAVFTLDGNASNAYTLRIYVDGELQGTETETFDAGGFNSVADLNIGWWQNPWGADFEFEGSLDEPAFYKKALSAAEIYKMYTDGLAHKAYCQPGNYAPVFKSTPILTATEDIQYSYAIVTADYDVANTLVITKATGPAWLTVTDNHNGTAVLSGTPLNADVATHPVVLAVNDGTVTINQSFSVVVANVNDLPTITSTPVIQAEVGKLYQYWVEAKDDEDGFPATCEAVLKPTWLTFSYNPTNGTGILSGTPAATDSVLTKAWLKVTDSSGESYTQKFNINVKGGFSAIDDLDMNSGVRVYPSPARDYVTIETEQIIRNGSFRLMSLSGALIKEVKIKAQNLIRIDLSDVEQGIYIYQLSGSGKQIMGKIAKE